MNPGVNRLRNSITNDPLLPPPPSPRNSSHPIQPPYLFSILNCSALLDTTSVAIDTVCDGLVSDLGGKVTP
ncbi:hypothetical protein LSTR_LSTR000540 [Laodelphax striatellus]|uniref:Uncharacterized protein n=1 Tax=Laodelphax striatellus TaxID=195883 RepID=A0A482XHX4_LAOST|nr:hypothetical protein LSTR_LSTR000540 [Laodelphax striatellus]